MEEAQNEPSLEDTVVLKTLIDTSGLIKQTCELVAGAQRRRNVCNGNARMGRKFSPGWRMVGPQRIHPQVRSCKQAVKVRAGRRTLRASRQNQVNARPIIIDARPRSRAPACVCLAPATSTRKFQQVHFSPFMQSWIPWLLTVTHITKLIAAHGATAQKPPRSANRNLPHSISNA